MSWKTATDSKTVERMEREARERAIVQHMIDGLPDDLPVAPSLIMAHGNVHFKATTYPELFALHAALPPIAAFISRNGCTALGPMEKMDKRDREKATPIGPVLVCFDPHASGQQYGSTGVEWWTRLSNGKTVGIKIEMPMGILGNVSWRTAFSREMEQRVVTGSTLEVKQCVKSGYQQIKWWSSPDWPQRYTLYWNDHPENAWPLSAPATS